MDSPVQDLFLLGAAAVEDIKSMRIWVWELENNQTITMARQHPGPRMETLLDRLSLTKKDRQKSSTAGTEGDEDIKEVKTFLSKVSG
jgi:hypothetical protein